MECSNTKEQNHQLLVSATVQPAQLLLALQQASSRCKSISTAQQQKNAH
jgi:hypothetical protein